MKKYVTPGIVLILAGIYFLLNALPGVSLPGGTLLVLLGLGLIIARLITGKFGYTIGGFLVLCLGGGFVAADLLSLSPIYYAVVVPISLALAFFLIHICEFRRIGNWPLVPALALLLLGGVLLVLFTPALNELLRPYYGAIFPAVLILVGICLLVHGLIVHSRQQAARRAQNVSYASSAVNAPRPDPAAAGGAPVSPAPEAPMTEPDAPVEPSGSSAELENESSHVSAPEEAPVYCPAETPAESPLSEPEFSDNSAESAEDVPSNKEDENP